MKKLFSAFAVLTAFALFTTSCKEDETTPAEDIPVAEVKVTPATSSLVAGTTLELKVQVLPENATNKTVTWGSRDEKIATVNTETGVVTGVAVGTVDIYATSVNKKTDLVKVTVTAAPIRVESVAIGEDFPLFVGKSKQLTATITPANATTQEVVWDSSNKAAATVDQTGKVVAVGDGKSTITATVDEKVGQCEVTVSIPDIADITMTTLDQGNTVTMTAAGFKAGDKVKLEALVAPETNTGEADVKDVTAETAKFDFPATLASDRSYKLTVMRGTEAKAEAYLRPDGESVRFPYELGYYLTSADELVPADPALSGSEWAPGVVRRGYVPGKIFVLDEATKEFIVWKADAKLCPATTTSFEFTLTTGVKNLDPIKGCFDFSSVTGVIVADSYLTSLDMTIFPNATDLLAWGNPGANQNLIETVNFGVVNVDPWCKLKHIQIERNSVAGVLNLRNCAHLNRLDCQDNQITGFDFGTTNVDAPLPILHLNAENNRIVDFSSENLGGIRFLLLKGNPIERLTLLNNSKLNYADGATLSVNNNPKGEEYVFIIKGEGKTVGDKKENPSFSLSWASTGERVFNVENYWWRVYSGANISDINSNNLVAWEGGWIENNPIVQAQKAGVKVICWTYHGQGDGAGNNGDSHVIPGHTHEGGTAPCVALP